MLYWYLSQETRHPVEVILTDRQSVKPLLAIRLNPPLQPGMQRVRLADYNIHLAPGVLYKWSVSLVRDAAQRSYDVTTAGTIERVELPNELRGQLVQANTMTSARLYATAGLWYDTIAALSELINTRPQDTTLRQQRATVLEQEGLTQPPPMTGNASRDSLLMLDYRLFPTVGPFCPVHLAHSASSPSSVPCLHIPRSLLHLACPGWCSHLLSRLPSGPSV